MKTFWSRLCVAILLLSASSLSGADVLTVYKENALAITQGMTQRDTSLFDSAVDADTIINTAMEPLILEPQFKRSFRSELKKVLQTQLGEKVISVMPDGAYAKLLRLKREGQVVKALVRLDYGDEGTAYMDLHLLRHGKTGVRIVDWFSYSSGELYTESLRALINLSSPTPTVLGKIFDKVTDNEKNRKAMGEMFAAQKRGEYRKVIAIYFGLSDKLQKSRVLNIAALQAASASNDEGLYLKVLGVLDKNHGDDPNLALMLIDYHYMNNDQKKVIATLKTLEKVFGVDDAAIKSLMANSYIESGDLKAALKVASAGVELEPEYENGYWSLMLAQVMAKQYAAAVDSGRTLEQRFGYEFTAENMQDNEHYAEFTRSAEFRQWQGDGS
jgi:tetratricopeptide (TPR) repeat protein